MYNETKKKLSRTVFRGKAGKNTVARREFTSNGHSVFACVASARPNGGGPRSVAARRH